MGGDVLYATTRVSPETRALLLELALGGPFKLEVFDPTDTEFQRVLSQIHQGAKIVIVPRLTDLGDGYRQILERLLLVQRAGGHIVTPLDGLAGSPEKTKNLIQVLTWVDQHEYARQSQKIRGAHPGHPRKCLCGHYDRKRNPKRGQPALPIHLGYDGPCLLCPESSPCDQFRKAPTRHH